MFKQQKSNHTSLWNKMFVFSCSSLVRTSSLLVFASSKKVLCASSRSFGLGKVITRFVVQGSIISARNMGTKISKSYSPSSHGNDVQSRGSIARLESTEEYVEAVVCKEDELKENEMKTFDIGDDGGKVLVIKQKGEISAIGTKCTHYGAPLISGALSDGRLRCPWHGACFNIKTGDIEDFPGFDSLPCYQVTVSNAGEVKIRAKKADLKSNKRIKDVGVASTPCESSAIVIVGGGPSGATCAETLRNEGFTGRITIVSKENYLPYDRIKISKIGVVPEIEKLQVRTQEYYQNANIEVLKGVEAAKVETQERFVHLSNGNKLRYSALYLATGSKPRVPNVPGIDLGNIFTVRNFDDSVNILSALGSAKDKNVVILGLSFIGLETAASCCDKAKLITVVGKDSLPLGFIFGKEIGGLLHKMFEEKGIKFEYETTIVKCNGDNGVVKSVELSNGSILPADVVILGVGATYYTDFLKGSGINFESSGAVTVNERLETNVKNIYAGGDIAHAPVYAHSNKQMSIGHIGLAQYHGRIAALNIMKKDTPLRAVPFFWTMLFGKSIRYAGCGKSANYLVDGDTNAFKFVIFFFDETDKVIAVASCMRDPVVAQFAEFLYQGKSLHKKDLKDDMYAWCKQIN